MASRYGVYVSGATEVALTKLDSLSGLDPLRICTHYKVGSRTISYFPIMPQLAQAIPAYIDMPGWKEDITGIRQYDRLPKAARDYVERIEQLVEHR